MNEQEIEVKFYIRHPVDILTRLEALSAEKTQARVFEINLRFDTPGREMASAHRVLRLRKDTRARLTYKGPAKMGEAASIRQEIEFEVSDFASARSFLEALGYDVSVSYEKYRTSYDLCGVEVSIDELPYGHFVEVEGPDVAALQLTAALLKLNWDARVLESYLAMFDRVRSKGVQAVNLVFSEFEGVVVTPGDLEVTPAD